MPSAGHRSPPSPTRANQPALQLGNLAKIVSVAAVAACSSFCAATPEFWEVYQKHYQLEKAFENYRNSCSNCHVSSPPKRNDYGKRVEAVYNASDDENLTPAMLTGLENEDTDGDGFPNGEEIRAGFLPADAFSHPQSAAKSVPQKKSVATEESFNFVDEVLWPAHSQHPIAVHFSIALVIFGALLDALGFRRRSDVLRQAGYWNLLGGLIAGVLTIPTGLFAFYRAGFLWEGDALIHFVLALTSQLVLLATLLMRQKRSSNGAAYWTLLAITIGLLSVAGHFGGLLVYG